MRHLVACVGILLALLAASARADAYAALRPISACESTVEIGHARIAIPGPPAGSPDLAATTSF